jgi:hypothetical protein
MNNADLWALFFLAVVLKIPVVVLVWVLWKAFRAQDDAHKVSPPFISRMALCGYCGSRITVGYDANLLHEQAQRIAQRSGEAAFDVESRLIRAAVTQPHHHPAEPEHCPDCGERTVWLPIEPIDLSGHAVTSHTG